MRTVGIRAAQREISSLIQASNRDLVVLTKHGAPAGLLLGCEGLTMDECLTLSEKWKEVVKLFAARRCRKLKILPHVRCTIDASGVISNTLNGGRYFDLDLASSPDATDAPLVWQLSSQFLGYFVIVDAEPGRCEMLSLGFGPAPTDRPTSNFADEWHCTESAAEMLQIANTIPNEANTKEEE